MLTFKQPVAQNITFIPRRVKRVVKIMYNGSETNYTIDEIARELGVSKTTVSRAISGKGRIGADTRNRILGFVEKNNYRPNPMAKGLANQKTYNICWAMPGDSDIADLLFFKRCLLGVVDTAAGNDYDILISMIYEDNSSSLERIINNRKADGVILGGTLKEDKNIKLLKNAGIPFVVIGAGDVDDVVRIDIDHVRACRELTGKLLQGGTGRIALIGGNMSYTVNLKRYEGLLSALKDMNIVPDPGLVYLDIVKDEDIEPAVEGALSHNAECIICMDDSICSTVVSVLRSLDRTIPEDIKVASFRNSSILDGLRSSISALQYDPGELGKAACSTLLKLVAGEETEEKQMPGYEILLKASTQ